MSGAGRKTVLKGGAGKRPFFPADAFRKIEKAIRPYPKAALFALYDRGYQTAFEQLVACVISIRTYDEVTLPCAIRLFSIARTPEEVAALSDEVLDREISPCTFHRAKVTQIKTLARVIVEKWGGIAPCTRAELAGLPGIGPKCAALVAGIAGGEPGISVDVHVHRVANRWGYVNTKSPEATMAALESRLPIQDWINVNRLLVPFGKHICTREIPKCSTCPVLEMCAQVGVGTHL